MKQLATQGSHLAEQQLKLVKAEIRESTAEMKTAVGGLVGAAVVGMAGLGVLLMGLAFLLGQAIDNVALATLIVGAATLGLAYVLYSSASKKMRDTHLPQSAANAPNGRRTLLAATSIRSTHDDRHDHDHQ